MAAPTSVPTQRHVRGPFDTGVAPVASGTQVNPGDLLLFYSGTAKSVQNFVGMNSGAELQSISGARAVFLGVALGQVNANQVVSGQPQKVTFATNGVFKYPGLTNSGVTYPPGLPVSFTMNQTSGYFQPQQIMEASGGAIEAIGRVVDAVRPPASGVGELTVYLQSTLIKGVIAGV